MDLQMNNDIFDDLNNKVEQKRLRWEREKKELELKLEHKTHALKEKDYEIEELNKSNRKFQDNFNKIIEKYENKMTDLIEQINKLEKESLDNDDVFIDKKQEKRNRECPNGRNYSHEIQLVIDDCKGRIKKRDEYINKLELRENENKIELQAYKEKLKKYIEQEIELKVEIDRLKNHNYVEKKTLDEEKEKHSREMAKLKEENRSLQDAFRQKDKLLASKDRDLLVIKNESQIKQEKRNTEWSKQAYESNNSHGAKFDTFKEQHQKRLVENQETKSILKENDRLKHELNQLRETVTVTATLKYKLQMRSKKE